MSEKSFLENYINLVASIEGHVDKFVWWSCPISSKNRFYERFTDILQGKGPSTIHSYNHLNNGLRLVRHIIILMVRIVINKILRRKKIKNIIVKNRGQKIFLIKTFAYDSTDFSPFQDPIFETLKIYLKKREYRVITLYEPQGAFKKSITQFNPKDMNLSYFDYIKIRDIFYCLYTIFKSYIFTLKKSFHFKFEGKNIASSFKSLYLFEHFSTSTFHAMTYYYLYRNLLNDFLIDRYYYTYENNSWERMGLMSFRKHSPQTHLMAHQHNVVPLVSANLFYGKGEEQTSPRPDIILTTGRKPKEILEKYGHYNQVPIRESCAVRYAYLDGLKPYPDNRKARKLLVALEGVWQIVEIIKVLFKQADALKNWEIIIRTHPELPYKNLKTKIPYSMEDYPHFKLSYRTDLKKDIMEASTILYWGSTVALEAIKLGRPLINIRWGHFNFDPLFELASFKWEWHLDRPLNDVLCQLETLNSSAYALYAKEAQNYLQNYFHPTTEENLQIFSSVKNF